MQKLFYLLLSVLSTNVLAAEAAAQQSSSEWAPLAAALAISVGALGGALAQGRLGAAAMEGISRNPQAGKSMFVPFIIGLGLIESLVIYCLIIAMSFTG